MRGTVGGLVATTAQVTSLLRGVFALKRLVCTMLQVALLSSPLLAGCSLGQRTLPTMGSTSTNSAIVDAPTAPNDTTSIKQIFARPDIHDEGALPGNTVIELLLLTKFRNAEILEEDYRRGIVVGRAGFDANFAPTSQRFSALKAQLQAMGFTISRDDGTRTILGITASARQINAIFGTNLHLSLIHI